MRWFRLATTLAQMVLVLLAAICLAGALVSERWVEVHFLPDFTISPAGWIAREAFARGGLAGTAALALFALVRTFRWRGPADLRNAMTLLGATAIAVVLALGCGEAALHAIFWRAFDPLCCGREPLRQYDAVLGWKPAPSRTAEVRVGDRAVAYTFDAHSLRIKDSAHQLDVNRPSILFAGESFMMGYLLPWDETIPGQVEALTGLQAVNLAVEGYSVAQASTRLRSELDRFHAPVAIVFLVLPSVFRKDIDIMRPRFDTDLILLRPEIPPRLQTLAHWLVPYESTRRIDQGVLTVQRALSAVLDLADRRGAVPLLLVPDVAAKRAGEIAVRQRVLDDAHLPYVRVPLAADWHVPGDEHPDARANRAMAQAIVAALARQTAAE